MGDQMSDSNRKPYDVGYGKPPKATQFKKGQSGNLRGRPKGALNLATIIQQELAKPIDVIQNGKTVRMTKGQVLATGQVNQALNNKPRAVEMVVKLSQTAATSEALAVNAAPILEQDNAIIERYIASRRQFGGGNTDDTA
jgi:Family of unknown function (DUF5681)